MQHAMHRSLLLLSPLALFGGCSDPAPVVPEARTFPEGTVLAVDDQPILAADVDRFVGAIELIEPQFVLRDHRRKVLSNISIPLAAGAALEPEARQVAFSRAQGLISTLRETGELPPDAPEPRVMTGTFKEVGLIPWAIATEMEPLTFSELHETPGAWTFFKLTATSEPPGAFVGGSQVTIVRYDVPYLPQDAVRGLLQTAMEGLQVEVIDPEWEPVIPPLYLYPSAGPR